MTTSKSEARSYPYGVLDREVTAAVARLGCATVYQLSDFLGWTNPKNAGDPYRKTRNHAVNAWKNASLEKRFVTRSQLAEKPDPMNAYGSAPDVFVLAAKGRAWAREQLAAWEVADTPEIHDKDPYAAHHLMIRDVRVWFERVARAYVKEGHRGILDCRFERQAAMPGFIPDAWFRYGTGKLEFGLFLEADRGTESAGKWSEKVSQYAALLAAQGDGSPLHRATGMPRARVLVVAPDAARRDYLWRIVSDVAPKNGIRPGRFLFCETHALKWTELDHARWRADGQEEPVPMVRKDQL